MNYHKINEKSNKIFNTLLGLALFPLQIQDQPVFLVYFRFLILSHESNLYSCFPAVYID